VVRRAREVALVLLMLLGGRAPAAAVEATIGGRRLELTGHVEGRAVFEVDDDTPDDDPYTEALVRLRAPLLAGLRFESAVVGRYGGPTTNSTGAGVYTFDDVFQSRSPSLEVEEAFVDWSTAQLDLRVGKQKFSWGRLDRFQAIDVLNPERFNDPFLLEEDERKIGVPAVQASYYPNIAADIEEPKLTLIWIPQYLPFRFSRPNERWFPPAAVPPDTFSVPAGIFELPNGQPNPPFDVPVGFRVHNSPPPSFRPQNSGYGARFGGFSHGVDFAFYYYHGFDSQPAFQLLAEALAEPATLPPFPFTIAAETELRPVFRRIDAWAADAAYAWGPFTMRAEAAFIQGRAFSRDLRFLVDDPRQLAPQIRSAIGQFLAGADQVSIDLGESFARRDAVEWGIGADYTLSGYLFLLQVNQTDVIDNDVDLLIEDVETRLLANLRKKLLHDDLELQLIAQHAIESDYSVLLPRLTYRVWKGLELRCGYLFLAGRQSSTIGQYKHNDEAFVRLRYLF
jgi:hypothetical protein